MGRTVRQNSRKRIENFYRSCREYATGKKQTPPRLNVTLPTWERDVKRMGIDPEDVFNDFLWWPEANKIAREIGTTPEKELYNLRRRHNWRVVYRNKRDKCLEEMTHKRTLQLRAHWDTKERLGNNRKQTPKEQAAIIEQTVARILGKDV